MQQIKPNISNPQNIKCVQEGKEEKLIDTMESCSMNTIMINAEGHVNVMPKILHLGGPAGQNVMFM